MPHFDITGNQGSTFSLTFRAIDCAGAAVSLSGYSLNSVIKESYSAVSGVTSFNAITTVPESGICNISLTASGSAAIPSMVYLYQVEASNPVTFDVIKLLYGHFLLEPAALI